MDIEQLWPRFNVKERFVKDFQYWTIIVRPNQVTLGACLFLLKRDATSLAMVEPEEIIELVEIVKWFEYRATTIFRAEKFNYVAAMMKDPFVHFHAFPRYSTEQFLYGVNWRDEAWPRIVELKGSETNAETLTAVRDALRSE
jgi:diadenosine tetraphosphate (Ap4A) HIT family hydrolase